MAKSKQSNSLKREAALSKINYNVSGIDLGSEEMFIAVIGQNVRKFSTFTKGLEDAAV